MQEILDILMFLVAIMFLMAGFPVAFTLAGTALVFGLIGFALGVFDLSRSSVSSRNASLGQ